MTTANRIAHSIVNGPVIQLGSVNVTLALSRPDYALQWIGPSSEPWLPPHRRTPSYLLDTRREIVPYRPRPTEEQRLETWLAGDAPMSVLLVHGVGGSGKTRLANAFAGFAYDQGWAVAQAVEAAPPGDAVTETKPVLVIADYAERWGADALLRMVSALPHDFPRRSLRVLLLARSNVLWPTCPTICSATRAGSGPPSTTPKPPTPSSWRLSTVHRIQDPRVTSWTEPGWDRGWSGMIASTHRSPAPRSPHCARTGSVRTSSPGTSRTTRVRSSCSTASRRTGVA